jgi:tetratricopeptide (TPR) repeat protein
MSGVFLSYRRSDSAYALLLYKALSQKFGRERVFRDFEDIPPGEDFVAALEEAIAQSAACLVIIGKGWLDGAERLAQADDFVRREIEAVLKRRTLVIPCLVGGSKMPASTAVPDSLTALLRRDAMTIGDEYFDRDTGILLDVLDKALSTTPAAGAARAADGSVVAYQQRRAVELLKQQLSRLQVRAVELIQVNEADRALDELSQGFDLIMQLLEWSPADLPLDLQLGYLYKTLGQALDSAGRTTDAYTYRDLALAMFNRVANTASAGVDEKAGAFNGLGNIYNDRGDLAEAVRSYRLALELVPHYAYAWHDLLGALLQQAQKGQIDLPAMEQALARLKATGAGAPGLGAAHVASLDAYVGRWRVTPAVAVRAGKSKARTPPTPSPRPKSRTRPRRKSR